MMPRQRRILEGALRFALRRSAVDWLAWLVLALIMGGAVVHSRMYRGVEVEEAFGAFRQAMNLVHARGFSCSAFRRVEGTTSPLFALLLVLPTGIGADPYAVAQTFGTLAFALCCLIVYLVVRSCLADRWSHLLGLAAAVVVASSPTLAHDSQTGMPTTVGACVVSVALWLHLRSRQAERRPPIAWAATLGLAALLTPESVVLFFVVLVVSVAWQIRAPGTWQRAGRELAAFAAIWIPWPVFRGAYFGNWIPHLVAPAPGPVAPTIDASPHTILGLLAQGAGTEMLTKYVTDHALGTGLLAGTLLLVRTRYAGLLVVVTTLSCVALVTWRGEGSLLHDQLLALCIAPLAAGMALGLRGLLFHEEQQTRYGHFPSVLAALAALAFVFSETQTIPVPGERSSDLTGMKELGLRLAAITRRDDLVVSELAGPLPYYWGASTVDLHGACGIDARGKVSSAAAPTDWEPIVAGRPSWYAFESARSAARFYGLPAFGPYRGEYYLLQYPYGYLSSDAIALPTLLIRKDRPDVDQAAKTLGLNLVDVGQELRRTGFLR